MNNTILKTLLMTVVLLCALIVTVYAQYPSVQKHPIEVEQAVCSQCHPDK